MADKADEAHRMTDEELAKLERRIAGVYREAADDLQVGVTEYFASFQQRDSDMRELVNAGKITPEYYKQWRLNQIGRGKRLEALRDKVAERYTNANEVAVSYVNDATPGIYSLNRNYAAYTIEQEVGAVDFILWDEQTVKRLIVEQPDLMPYYPVKRAVKRGIDLAYGKKQITASITSSILLGRSVKEIADDLQERMQDMNRTSAIRTARTAITCAQNAGRMDTCRQALEMGIKLKKQWLATLDNRTRHAHQKLDGQIQDVETPFDSELGDIMFPGDSGAKPGNIYNCRCRLLYVLDGADMSNAQRRARDPETGEWVLIENMTFDEWSAWKRAENPEIWEDFVRHICDFSNENGY